MTAVSLSANPILQFLNNQGQPNAGGSILTQVGGVNYATYQDSAGTIPLPNPIPLNSRGEISNSAGVSCQLFLVNGVTYTFTLYDSLGNQINQASFVSGSGSILTLLSASSGSSLVGYMPAGTGGVSTTVQSKLRESVSVMDFGAKGDGVTDDTAAIQAAINFAITTHASIHVPATVNSYRVTAPLNIQDGIHILGSGTSPYRTGTGTIGYGSWFLFDHLGKGFNITSASGNTLISGIYFDHIGTQRKQPAPVAGWAPVAADFDIYINNADVHIRDVCLLNPTKGIQLFNGTAGRLNIDRLSGQPFKVGLDIDSAYDVVNINGVHWWPYWNDNAFVEAYTMQNLDGFYFRRCDNPKLSNIFTIFARSGMRFGENALGRTLKIKVVNADFDRGKYGIWIDSTVTSGVLGFFQNVTHQGEGGVAGSEMLRIEGNSSTLDFGALRTDLCGTSAIEITGVSNIVRIASATVSNWNQDVVAAAAVVASVNNTVDFAVNPTFGGGGGAAKYSGAGFIYTDDWRTWVPVVTAQTGTITTVGAVVARYQARNNVVSFNISITITTNGTGSGGLIFTLPPFATAASDAQAVGREVALTGNGLHGTIVATGNSCLVTTSTNAYPGGTGAVIILSGRYQY